MRSIQDYRNIYREIATKLGITGDSTELLVQMLSQFSYINEIENMSYLKESSIENSVLMNSKIQHCVDNMYSVFRGRCPRVILKFKPTKYFSFDCFQEIITLSSFSIYYLGYFDEDVYKKAKEEKNDIDISIEDGFVYEPLRAYPSTTNEETTPYTIIGLLSPELVEASWTTDVLNRFYVDCIEEDLSNDMYLKLGSNTTLPVTREFGDHINYKKVFDLTLPSYGSRLYLAGSDGLDKVSTGSDEIAENQDLNAYYFKYSILDSYNQSELKRISMSGAEFVQFEFSDDDGYTDNEVINSYPEDSNSRPIEGVLYIDEMPRDTINSLHYQINKNKFISSVMRSNSDLGTILEESFPDYIKPGGVTYKFMQANNLTLFYVPREEDLYISEEGINKFIEDRKAYFMTSEIKVQPGEIREINVKVGIKTDGTKTGDEEEVELRSILNKYEGVFGITNLPDNDELKDEIKTLIGKMSSVQSVYLLEITDTEPHEDSIPYYYKIKLLETV